MNTPQRILILSGETGTGKTSLCLKVLELVKMKGLKPAGVISPGLFEIGAKTGIQLVDASSGAEYPLARLFGIITDGPATRKWQFYEEAILTGNNILGKINSCDILFIDEMGPLEFERGEGWQMGFRALAEADYEAALVVIRPSLVEKALELWENATVFKITPHQDIENTSSAILSILLGD